MATGTLELLEGAADLLVLGAAARRRRRLADHDADLAARTVAQAGGAGLGAGLGVLGIGLAMIGATVAGVLALADGRLAPTALAVLALTPLAAAELVAGLPDAATRLAEAGPAARRLAELESGPAPVADPARPAPVPADPAVTAEALAVRWPDALSEAVSGVSFVLPPGGRMVLAGPSGAGKSTVLAALLRSLPAARGAVALDGHDTATMAAEEVRDRFGWCGPAAHLFDSTLRENLRLARPGATDDELVVALRHARLGAWFASLPDGLDTALGDHGGAVSGGERQRLAVTRVLIADRPILALDEPTAHLDAPTATALAGEISELSRGRTAIVVSHRPGEFPDLPVVTVGSAPQGVPGPSLRPPSSRDLRRSRR